jgi:hypothetical protein
MTWLYWARYAVLLFALTATGMLVWWSASEDR